MLLLLFYSLYSDYNSVCGINSLTNAGEILNKSWEN